MTLCMHLLLYISVQNEVKRIVFIKPSYTVSFYGYVTTLMLLCSAFCLTVLGTGHVSAFKTLT